MSLVFKRFPFALRGERLLISRERIYPWLHDEQGSSGSKTPCHARMYHVLHLLPASTTSHLKYSELKSMENRRAMSILTDLLRRKKKNDDYEDEVIPDAKTLPLFEDTPKELTDEEIEAKRNISRVHSYHQRLIHGQHPYTEPVAWLHHTVRYKQRMFGRYGESSGVNPGLLWPTRDELKEKIEYERICNPFTIQEMVEKKQALRKAEKEIIEKRIKKVEATMAIVDKYKEELFQRQETKQREANEAKERREKLMEEVRRHFGYTVDSRDEKFQELLAKKEKEQRKAMKEARKLEKQHKMLQKLEAKEAPEKSKNTKTSSASTPEDDKEDK